MSWTQIDHTKMEALKDPPTDEPPKNRILSMTGSRASLTILGRKLQIDHKARSKASWVRHTTPRLTKKGRGLILR